MKSLLLSLLLAPLAAFARHALAMHAEFGWQETYPAVRADADLSQFQYRVVRFTGADGCNVASNDVSAAYNEMPRGILQNNPSSGRAASIAYLGQSKAVAGAAMANPGTPITTNGSGKVVAATSGDIVIGATLEAAGAENDIISVQLFPPMRAGSVA